MKTFVLMLGLAALLLGAGCTTNTVQQLPALSLQCVVVDHVTRRPIPGAWVSILDRPASGSDTGFYYGPFVTNADGIAKVSVQARTTDVTESDLYYRSADVQAPGHVRRLFNLDTVEARAALKAGGTYTFELFPARTPIRRMRVAPKVITWVAPAKGVILE